MSGAPDQLVKKHEKKKKKRRKHKKSTLDIQGVVPSTLFMLPLTLEALTKSWTQKDQLI